MGGEEVRPGVKRYRPPFAEFQVEAIEVGPGASLDIPECPGASILLVQRGGDSTASFTLGKAALRRRRPSPRGACSSRRPMRPSLSATAATARSKYFGAARTTLSSKVDRPKSNPPILWPSRFAPDGRLWYV